MNATLKHHILKYKHKGPDFAQRLFSIVNDITTGDQDDNGAYQLYVKTKSRLAEGGFNVRIFVSISNNFVCKVEENERLLKKSYQGTQISAPEENSETVVEEDESYAKSATHSPDTLSATEKVLRFQWNKEEDKMVLDLNEVAEDSSLGELSPTKRDAAWTMSKIYDSVGFITPLTVKMKLFCQSLCKKKKGWDKILDESSRKIWSNLLKRG